MLEDLGYEVTYLADEAVSLSFVRYNLTADVIYYNTHAGYWDTDGDNVSDSVIIGVGEKWTNDTPSKYPFEYSNGMIFEGTVGGESYVAFTPSFIEYYYDDFHGSLVYMATCHATFDDSMANAFLDANASVYMGWTKNTVFWTNSFTSVVAFKLFSMGFNVKQVCNIIRCGGIYNFIFRSKLTFFGDGNYKIQ